LRRNLALTKRAEARQRTGIIRRPPSGDVNVLTEGSVKTSASARMTNVRFVPTADIPNLIDYLLSAHQE